MMSGSAVRLSGRNYSLVGQLISACARLPLRGLLLATLLLKKHIVQERLAFAR
jgi:hypothetical protein